MDLKKKDWVGLKKNITIPFFFWPSLIYIISFLVAQIIIVSFSLQYHRQLEVYILLPAMLLA